MTNWKKVKLGEVCIVERGGSPRPISEFITTDKNGVNWIKIGDTSSDSMYISSTKEKIKPEGVSKSRYVQAGDFLLTNSMSFGRPYILKVDGCIHDGWLVLKDTNKIFNKRFLYYLLSSDYIYSKFKSMAVGGVVNNLNSEMVRNLDVSYPPIKIQEKIANVLEVSKSLIDKRKEQIKACDELIKSKYTDMFEKGKEFNADLLLNLCEVKGGKRIPKGMGFSDEVTKHPYLRATDMKNSTILLDGLKYITNDVFAKIKNYTISKDDVYLTNVGINLGMAGTIPDELDGASLTENSVKLVFDKTKLNGVYLAYYLNSPKTQKFVNERKMTVGVPKLAIFRIETIPLIIPPIELQKKFAAFAQQIEHQKSLMKQSLTELENNFNSLMQRAFSGELFPEE